LIRKADISGMGTKADDQCCRVMHSDDQWLWQSIMKACKWIFVEGIGVTGKWIQDVLSTKSQLPNQVCLPSYISMSCRSTDMIYRVPSP
jgi:hypothetical protein